MSDPRDFGMALSGVEQAHQQIVQAWQHEIKPRLEAGEELWFDVQPLEDARTLAQNRFYWKAVLGQISEKAQIDGIGATPDGWHLYFKRLILGYRFRKVNVPGKKRPSIIRELRSTKDLSVKQFAEYIDKVQAHAATVFLVEFSERLPQELRPATRAKPRREHINPETGEITEEVCASI